MKISKLEISIILSFIEYTSLKQDVCQLNEKGIKKLAHIQSKMAAKTLNINSKDVYDVLEKNLLETVKYSK